MGWVLAAKDIEVRAQPTPAGGVGGSRRVFGAAVVAAAVVFAGGAVLLTAGWVGARQKLLLSDVLFVLCAVAVAAGCLHTARRTTGALRRSWSLFAAMGAAWTVGNVVWFPQSLEPVKPFPTASDVFFVVALVLGAAGLLRFPTGTRVKNGRVHLLLDGLLIGASVLFLSNVLVLGEIVDHLGGGLGTLVLVTYPLADVLLASLAVLLLTRSPGRGRMDLVLLAGGLLVYAVEDTVYALLQARGQFHTGTPFDLGWIGGYLLVALGALTFSARSAGAGPLRAAVESVLGDLLVNLVMALAVLAAVYAGLHDLLDAVLGASLLVVFGVRQGVLASDNHALRRGLELLAETDPLTGLANRRGLERDLDRLQRLAARSGSTLCLAVLDLDHFKRVNDRYGHAVGDEILRRLSTHLKEAFRGEDAIARIGGEEFVVAVLGLGREDAVTRLGGVLAAFAHTAHDVDGQAVSVAASAGVAEHHRDGIGFEALYRAADDALRVAKLRGRARVVPAGAHAPPPPPDPHPHPHQTAPPDPARAAPPPEPAGPG